jgi:hypothetical protein
LQKKGRKRHDCVTIEDGRKKSKKGDSVELAPSAVIILLAGF